MFLVKREESRYFDVFFGCFLCVLVFGREKKYVEKLGKEKNSKKKCVFSWLKGCLGLFIALACFSRQRLLKGCQWPFKDHRPQKASNWTDLDSL